MMKNYKRITAGMMAGFCVISTQNMLEYVKIHQGGGANFLCS